MNRSLTAAFAALEAVIVVGVGVGIPLVPLTVLWAVQYGFATDWFVFWRASVDSWLLGHGVDLQVRLDSTLASSLGLAEPSTFPVTIAALGFALLTLLLAMRAGRRVGETPFRTLGSVVALGTFAVVATAVTLTALYPLARPSVVQGIGLPTLVFALGFAIGMARTRRAAEDDAGSSLRDWVDDWSAPTRALVGTALRGGAAVVAGVLAVSAVLLAVLITVNYAEVIAVYERLHAGGVGGLALTLGEIAFMPNLVIWVASWLVGPGFAIGTGSSVSPLGTQLGPVPAVPVLGALPSGDLAFGFLGLVVPIAVAFLVAAALRTRLVREVGISPLWLGGAALALAAVAAVLLGVLALAATGAIGPGRLADVGPAPLWVGFWTFVEVAPTAALAFFTARPPRADR